MVLVDTLLKSSEPSIRYKTRVNILNENPNSALNKKLREGIRTSARVQRLLSNRDESGKLEPVNNTYQKWFGAHWVLVHLAELCYPEGDKTLFPLREQLYGIWLTERMLTSFVCKDKKDVYKADGVIVLENRARRCASQQGNALYSLQSLGITDNRTETLVQLLLKWQWPDGGWNCDRNPDAHVSSFKETLTPLRGLAEYLKSNHDIKVKSAVKKAAEVFLKRKLFKKISDGKIINNEFIKLHFPCYWHYDILYGLKVIEEAGFIKDKRCDEALDLLESKQLKSGGWSAGGKYYKFEDRKDLLPKHNYEIVDWATKGNSKMSEWITVDALHVLLKAGRIKI